jgi:glycosyltransferase involved in cell wall biosynthesis
MIKVLYYVPYIDRNYGGIYQYTVTLLKILAEKLQGKCIFYVYSLQENEDYNQINKEYNNLVLLSELIVESKELIKKRKNIEFKNKFFRRLSHQNVLEVPLPNIPLDFFLNKEKIDIVHCPYTYLPKNSLNIPTLTTMHDVQELHFPQFFNSEQRASRAVNNKNFIDNATHVIVSYEHIKKDIIKFFDKPNDEVHVCLLEMNELWFSKYQNEDNRDKRKKVEYDNYILCPAATWEHKNHIKLLDAIHYLREKLDYKINLICTGSKNSYYDNVIEPYIEKLNLKEQVNFLGVVDDELLFNLYQNTKAVVIPTLYEAGSFPLMESILMNVPVICSNTTSLPDTIKNEKFIFNPYDKKDIAQKIKSITSEEQFIAENIQNSIKVSKYIQNTGVADKIYSVYTSCLQQK